MDQAASPSGITPEAFTLGEFARELWRLRVAVILVALACAVAGVIFALASQKEYEASVTFSPVLGGEGGRLGGIGGLVSEYSGLAALAGLTVPGRDKGEEAVAVLQSELLTRTYIKDNDLLPVLYSKIWDSRAKKWSVSDPRRVPTLWGANQFFAKRIRRVVQDHKSGMYVVTIRWRDPVLAAKWANGLVALTNGYLRSQAIDEAERSIAYLNSEASKTTMVEERRAIYTLLENEIDTEMIARGRSEYALKVIDPAFVPESPSTPGAKILGILGFILGLSLAAVAVLVYHGWRGVTVNQRGG